MFDFGCHRIEVLLNLFGPVSKVQGELRNILFEREVEDTCVAVLQFAAGPCGVITVTHAAQEAQDTLDIFGSRGSLHVANLNAGTLRIKTVAGERTEIHPPHANLHQPLIEDFAQAVLTGRAPQTDGAVGREVARIEAEIYQSL
jgi:predicted dehydrogenase